MPNQPDAKTWVYLAPQGWHGDHKSRRECHGFKHHYNAMWMCDECCAQKRTKNANPHLSYKDFRPDAPHKLTRFEHAGYVRCALIMGSSPYTCVSGWSLKTNFKDIMHVLMLGAARDHVANHICVWLESGLLQHICLRFPAAPGEPEADHTLRVLWLDFRKWCRGQGYGQVHGMPLFFFTGLGSRTHTSARRARRRVPERSIRTQTHCC